jgi:hypothetical protein
MELIKERDWLYLMDESREPGQFDYTLRLAIIIASGVASNKILSTNCLTNKYLPFINATISIC